MGRLFLASVIVLVLLFGLVLAVGTGVLYYYHMPVSIAILFAVGIITLQYVVGPFMIDWIYKIRWIQPEEISPQFAQFYRDLCAKRGMIAPRFGIIEDGNPNAFTYGHIPADARVVVTRGLEQMLSEDEFNAVVAHEIGHVKHYDFIVMSIASLASIILYYLYVWTRNQRRGGLLALVIAVGSYLMYVFSQYVVLFLSRIREYFADEHSAFSINDANALSRALIKIAYGLAKIPQVDPNQQQNNKNSQYVLNKSQLLGSLGICSFSSSSAMAINSTNGSGNFSISTYMDAMQWDLWNPWAKIFELQSTHPLIARRVQAASRMAVVLRQTPEFTTSAPPKESYWPLFWTDLTFICLPWAGLAVGLVAAYVQLGHTFDTAFAHGLVGFLTAFKLAFLMGGLGWMMRLFFSYGSEFKPAKIADLAGEVEVSHFRSIPVEIDGQVIGRGVPGLFWSKDLVMQDESGFVTVIYKQPLSIIETLFGMLKAADLIGKKGKFTGWYRRGPIPYLELNEIQTEFGSRIRCYYRKYLWIIAVVCTFIGGYLTLLGTTLNSITSVH
ncbi:MAG: zinc metalloprotease HtpX [Armatimonadota bacterium]|nr:zinc metalloprotease HtpX [bacterium]